MNLVLIETSGNQAYVFATNKLRENVGASQWTFEAGTRFVSEGVAAAGGPTLPTTPTRELRRALRDRGLNAPIESGTAAEVIFAASGKALVLVRDADVGRHIVEHVTRTALKDAPGLHVTGAVGADFDWSRDALDPLVGDVHRSLERAKASVPGPHMRFLRLPITAPCATSGLPAAAWDGAGPEPGARSAASRAKRQAAPNGFSRLREVLQGGYDEPGRPVEYRFPDDLDELERRFDGVDWLAVVHADGNGLGAIFQRFGELVGATAAGRNRDYVDQLREVSLSLDEVTTESLLQALRVFGDAGGRQRRTFPALPLVLGGDDLTMICEGRRAIHFTRAFLEAFEAGTAAVPALASIARAATGVGHLTACAGVAIVKPHYPFHAAYELAEALLVSAKSVKTTVTKAQQPWPTSALDFHVLYDSSGADLDSIRRRIPYGLARPYLVGTLKHFEGVDGPEYCARRSFRRLDQQVTALTETDDEGRRKLASSQMHWLREGLARGVDETNARLRLIHDRYRNLGLDALLVPGASPPTLFWNEGKRTVTSFLDAMEASEFYRR